MTHNQFRKSVWARAVSVTVALNLLVSGLGVSTAFGGATTRTGGHVHVGDISGVANGTTAINQNSAFGVISWDTYGIAAGDTVNYNFAVLNGLNVNYVTGSQGTDILGALIANNGGSVWVLNPNGVLLGKDATINAGAFVASTADISGTDWIGEYGGAGPGTGGASALAKFRGFDHPVSSLGTAIEILDKVSGVGVYDIGVANGGRITITFDGLGSDGITPVSGNVGNTEVGRIFAPELELVIAGDAQLDHAENDIGLVFGNAGGNLDLADFANGLTVGDLTVGGYASIDVRNGGIVQNAGSTLTVNGTGGIAYSGDDYALFMTGGVGQDITLNGVTVVANGNAGVLGSRNVALNNSFTTSGKTFLSSTDDDIILGDTSVTTAGSLVMYAHRNVTLDGVTAVTTDGAFILAYDGDIIQNAGSTLTVAAGNLDLWAKRDITLDGTTAVTDHAYAIAGRNVTLNNSFTAAGHTLLKANGTGPDGNVTLGGASVATFGTLEMEATRDITQAAGSTLTVNSPNNLGTGFAITMSADRDITLDGITAVTTGDARATAGRNLALNNSFTAAGHTLLKADGTGPDGNVTLGGASVTTVGSLGVDAVRNVTLDGIIAVTVGDADITAGRNIRQSADSTLTVDVGDLGMNAGRDITLNGATAVTTGGAALTAGRNLALNNSFTAGGHTLLKADGTGQDGNITLGGASVTTVGSLDVNAARNVTLDGIIAVTVGDAGIAAGRSITQGAGGTLTVDVGDLTMGAGRDITLNGATAITLGDAWLSTDRNITFNGTFGVDTGSAYAEAGRNITLNAGVNAGQDALLDAGRTVRLNADLTAGGNVSVLATRNVRQRGGLNAGGTVDVEAGNDILMSGDGATVSGGNIQYKAGRDVALTSVTTDGDIRIEAVRDILDANDDTTVNITANGAQLVAGGTVGTAGGTVSDDNTQAVDVNVRTLAVGAGADGSIYVQGTGDLTIGNVAAVPVNRVNFDGTLTGIAGFASVGATAGQNVKIKNAGNMAVADGDEADMVSAVNGDVLLMTTAGDLTIGGNVTAADHVTLMASGLLTLGANVRADGNHDLVGDAYVYGAGGITQTAGSTLEGVNLTLTAAGDITLASLIANEIVSLDTSNGDIIDGNGDALNISALRLRLNASNGGIGAGDALEIQQFGAADPAEGAIFVEANAAGAVGLTTPGTLVIGGVGEISGMTRAYFDSGRAVLTDLDGNPVTMPALDGLSAGSAALTAGGSIVQTRQGIPSGTIDSTVNVRGASTLRAGGDIYLGNAVNDFGGAVSAQAGGDIVLRDRNDLTLGNVTAGGSVWGEAIGGGLTVNALNAGDDVWLGAEGGSLSVGHVRSGGDAWLEASRSILAAGGAQTVVTVNNHGYATISAPGVNVSARSVGLVARGGSIGSAGAGLSGLRTSLPISVQAGSTAASASGDIAIYGQGNLTLGSVSATRWATSGSYDGYGAGDHATRTFSLANITSGRNVSLTADRAVNGRGVITADQLVLNTGDHTWLDHHSGLGSGIILRGAHGGTVDLHGNTVAGGPETTLIIVDTLGGLDGEDIRAGAQWGSGVIIFINGIYMGGDPRYVARIAAAEAFPAETPELKSKQGVFGDPIFVHDELDLVEPVALGLIEHLFAGGYKIIGDPGVFEEEVLEVPAAGLTPRNTIWFERSSRE